MQGYTYLEEEVSHRGSRREIEAGLHAGEEEARKLEARVEGLLEEASNLRTGMAKLTEGERCNASGAKEVRALRDRSAAHAAASRERIGEPGAAPTPKTSDCGNADPRSRCCEPISMRA